MNVKKIRLERKYTVPDLAKLSGLSVRTIENIEKRSQSTVANAIKIADTLGVTLNELCRDDVSKEESNTKTTAKI